MTRSIYDALVRLVQPWSLRYPLALGQGNFGSPGNDGAAAPRYTETKMAPLALEMVRDIDEDTVDFQDNYDGRTQEPSVLPARFPNLLVNGSVGIAVGMATNIPPHNLREVAAGALWYLENPDATREELLEALMQRIKGPDFPTGAQILGVKGIHDAYRTGRGSITMRAVVNVEELQGRTCLVVTELPYQVNPDNLAIKIADLVKDGKLAGIADIRDETSGRTGQRLVIVLKRDAVAKVVLNNLYKHTQLQENFGANMLAIVDGIPRTLSLDGFITHWVDHQIEVIVRRTQFRLRKAEARAHILRGYLKALDALDEVIALIRRSPDRRRRPRRPDGPARRSTSCRPTRSSTMQLRRLAALERQKIIDEADELEREIADYQAILAPPERQRTIVTDELTEIVDQVRRRPPHRDHVRLRRRHERRRPHPRRGDGGHRHPRRLRQAHAQRQLPQPAPRRQGRQGRAAARRRRRRALLRHHDAPLAAVLHEHRPRLPREGLRDRRRPAATRRASTSRTCSRCSPTRRSPQILDIRDYAVAHVPGARHPRRPRQEDRAHRVRHQPHRRHHRHQPARGRRARLGDARRRGRRRCCSSRARACRSASRPPTRRCAPWAARPRV